MNPLRKALTLGVLASGAGTTLQAVLDAIAAGELAASVGVVISNNGGSGAIQRAHAAGIATRHLSGKTHPEPGAVDVAIAQALQEHHVDCVLLAGYMKKLGPRTLEVFSGRILNTHPALLPKFGGQGMYGMHVHEAVLAAGETVTGATVHQVVGEYDTGPIIARTEVPVLAGDTPELLAQRVQQSERALLVRILRELAEGTRTLTG